MKNKRYQIGVPGWRLGDNSFGVTLPYLVHLTEYFGADVHILPPMKSIHPWLDLVLLPGGKDISPWIYKRVPGYMNSDPDQFKEAFMRINLDQYIKAGVPVFGTCLGIN